MHRITITRAEFKAAIEAGIAEAPRLPQKYVDRLRKLGDRARTVGGNYGACPATRVGAYRPGRGLDAEGRSEIDIHKFVGAYDNYLWGKPNGTVAEQYHAHDWHDVVRNKHGEEIIFIKD